MKLKKYQTRTLDRLEAFCESAVMRGPKGAFEDITQKRSVAQSLGSMFAPYQPLLALPQVPRVCLRLPTGAGKTIIAAHAIPRVSKALLGATIGGAGANPFVLWLTPTNTVREQTVAALRDPDHPYHHALRDQLGELNVFDIADFAQLPPQSMGTRANIFVGTIQTLRVSNTDGRKVYAHHEALEPHFARLLRRHTHFDGLEPISETNSNPRYSFANLLHIQRPIVIVDEAHRAVTGLSDTIQERVNPCAVVELTATPRPRNNTLINVSAREVYDAEMIKLPVRLRLDPQWQATLTRAARQRDQLEDFAARDHRYIRPVALYQAQKKNQSVTVEVLRDFLIDELNIPETQIAVATGSVRDLDGHDLMSRSSNIRHVITVEALKEGWDCPFAYVFASVANVSSNTDAEQLLGRVLRQPYAQRRAQDELNRAYAFISSRTFGETAQALRDGMVSGLGFTDNEVAEVLEVTQPDLDDDLFGPPPARPPISDPVAEIETEAVDALRKIAVTAQFTPTQDGKVAVSFTGVPAQAEVDAVAKALPEKDRAAFKAKAQSYRETNAHRRSAADDGEQFALPGLAMEMDGAIVPLDPNSYADYADFSLERLNPRLSEDEFSMSRDEGEVFKIDLTDGTLTVASTYTEDLLNGLGLPQLEMPNLAGRLARELRHPMTGHGELVGWVSKVLIHLTDSRGLALSDLATAFYPLLRVLRRKLDMHRADCQQSVFANVFKEDRVRLGDENFVFRHGMFDDVRMQAPSGYAYQKHFLGPDRIPAMDGKVTGEEVMAARALDAHPSIKHWVRNPSQHRNSFRLPLSDRNFYPDFIAVLEDGRLAVIEYKGEPYKTTDDSKEKISVGRAWAHAMGDRGVFVFLVKEDDQGRDLRDQLSFNLDV